MALASETLALLFQFPRKRIPGGKVPVPDEIKEEIDKEYKATIETLKIFTSRPKWQQRVLDVFKRLENETFPDVERCVRGI